MKINFFFIIIFCISSFDSFGQVSNDPNNFLYTKYSSNSYIANFDINDSGSGYAYSTYNNENYVFYNDKLESINYDKIVHLGDENYYYLINRKIFRRSVTKKIDSSSVSDGLCLQILKSNRTSVVLFDNNQLLILRGNNHILYDNVMNFKSLDLPGSSSKVICFSRNKLDYLIINDNVFELEGSISNIIFGVNEILVMTNYNNFVIDYVNNCKKNILIKHDIKKKVLDNLESNMYSDIFFIKDKILFVTSKRNISNDKFYLSNNILDLNYISKLARKDGLMDETDISILTIDLISGMVNVIDNIFPGSLNKVYVDNIFVISTNIIIRDSFPVKELSIFNAYYNYSLVLNELIPDYKSYSLSGNHEYIFVSDKKNNLFRFLFKNKKIDTIYKNYPFWEDTYHRYTDNEPIRVSSYNCYNDEVILKSSKYPYIIKNNGSVDSIVIPELKNKSHLVQVAEHLNNVGEYIIYSLDEMTNVSSIFYVKKEEVIKLSENDNFKIFQNKIYQPESTMSGYFSSFGNNIYWTETNLKHGLKMYKFDTRLKTKMQLEIKTKKPVLSLDYEYISYLSDSVLIKGCLKYPYGFDKTKKYPLILSIYLNKTEYLHSFSSIGSGSIDDFSIGKAMNALVDDLYFLTNNYIVAYIDVPFLDETYSSHSYYINTFIKNVFYKKYNIDSKNIGILGHSRSAGQVFGALTSDTLIKCAVISNGILSELLDLTDFRDYKKRYSRNVISGNDKYSRFYRKYIAPPNVQNYFFSELKNGYKETILKDPFFYINKINSSILFLFNDNDASISSNNSYFVYMKSKLLNKNTYLLNFFKEGHNISDQENMVLAYNIITNYLDFYLKKNNNSNEPWSYSK